MVPSKLSAVTMGKVHDSASFSQAVSVRCAGAAGNTTFGAGAQPATAFRKAAGPFGSQAPPISFGNSTPSTSSQSAPAFGAAANQQSSFGGNPAAFANQPGMTLASTGETSKDTAMFAQLFSKVLG